MYDRVFTQLARSYEFVIKDDGLGVQLKMKAINIMP